MKWLDKLNERAPDDLKLNLVHIVFWGCFFGTAAGWVIIYYA
jgi:hypothetical protein